ncbi:MAG: EamA family transporter, partial [Streptosporangiaceae bacterium]
LLANALGLAALLASALGLLDAPLLANVLGLLEAPALARALGLAAPLLGVRRPRRRDLPLIALCGLAGMTGYQLLLNAGERVVPAGTASLLVATAPVYASLLAVAFLG